MEEIWYSAGMQEFPFWHDGITPEEFEEERKYFLSNPQLYHEGKYIPLYKQKELSKE